MNVNVNRRSILSASAAVAVTGSSGQAATLDAFAATKVLPTSAGAVSDASAPSKMAQLIADYREADDQQYQAWWKCEELEIALDIPAVRVSGGRGMCGEYWLYIDSDIDRHYDRLAKLTFPESAREALNMCRARAHEELNRLVATRHQLCVQGGLAAAQDELEMAAERRDLARAALLSYVPATVDEYRERDTFLHDQMLAGMEFDDEDLKALFAA